MTRPKADADPWLTDPVSRDKVIAKTVVEGMRTIIGLLRTIRDENAANRAILAENRSLREDIGDLQRELALLRGLIDGTSEHRRPRHRTASYVPCSNESCSLPVGHPGNHRGSVVSQQ